MINQVWLKTFCTLADVGHFTQTANRLFMTQSGVSQHIKKLEQQLDVALLVREGKSFSLTEAGSKLHQQGQKLLLQTDELAKSIKQDDPFVGIVKIASPGSVGLKLYPQLLAIQQQSPQLIIDYAFAPNTQIEQDLITRKIELGLMTQSSKSTELVNDKIALEPLVLVTASEIKSVNWNKLLELGFISHPDAAHHGQLLLSENFAEFKHIEQFPHKGFSNQIGLILEPVSRGLGFTVLPLYAVNAFDNKTAIRMHTLTNPVGENIYLCHNKNTFVASRTKYIKSLITGYLNAAK
ncbi:LysR family transcriptional regulator [Thalassomonas actiniarum]|uniref:LysR family transcriptional regulator n=1 Tax=Thalassomonas actiniarum TaxID=485447 RepID=A0AAE9YR54_9GAMM|nr:LysR family transcriptional regulator [Thalassomonas actiniarum]WDD99724.1 LysR family transcriptional regulator [Thalassomonas actiniarum]